MNRNSRLVFFVGIVAFGAAAPPLRAQGAAEAGRAPTVESAREAAKLALSPPGFASADYDKAALALLDKVGEDPASPFAMFFVTRAAGMLDRAADRTAILERAAKIAEDPRAGAKLKKRLSAMRVELAMRRGDEATLLRSGDQMPQFIAKAAAIGPFGDAVPDALSVPYAPEKGLPLRAKAEGLGYSRTLEWQPIARRGFESHLDFSVLSDPPGGVRYLNAQIRSDRARPAYLALATPGSTAVWWNGEEVARLDLANEMRRPIEPIPVLLRAGWNRCLLKLEGRGATWASMSLIDGNGNPIEGLEEEGQLVDHEIAPKPEGGAAPPPFETLDKKLGKLLADSKLDPAARADILALRGLVEAFGERPSEALADLRAASELDEKRPELAYALAEGFMGAGYLPDVEIKNRARESVDRAIALDPNHVPSLLLRAELLARDDRMEEALTALDAAAKANPKCALVPMSRMNIFGKLNWQAERRKALEDAAARAPRKADLHAELAREARNSGDTARERKELDAAAAIDASHRGVSSRRAELWCLNAEGARALSEWERWVRWYRRPEDREALASTLECLGRAEEALEIRQDLAARVPRDAELQLDVAQMERALGRDENAKKTYSEVLTLEPGSEVVRSWMREIEGRFAGDEFFAKYRPNVEKAIAEYKPTKEHERANDVLVVDFQAERVLPDGTSELEITSVHRINDQQGVEKHGSAQFQGELMELKVVHPDGTIDEPTPAKGDYALPNIKPGDFVVTRSRVHDAATPGERPMRGRFQFQSQDTPYVISQYVLALPKGSEMRLVEKNFDGEHEIVETDQEVVHVMTKTNSPRILPESLQPNPEVFLPWVRAGVSAEVNDLNRSYRAQLLRSMEVTEEIKKAARDAVAKAGAKTDREKAAALYAFTNDTLIERGGGSATRSLLEKRGNPFALFGALLEAEGVPFDVAMARGVPKAGDDEPQAYFLDPQRYRHPMLRIAPREGGAPMWIDVGARLQPFGALPSAVSASEIFVTSDKESRIETLPTLPDDESTALDLSTVVELGTGQAARVTIDMTFHNVQAWNARERIKNFTADVRKTIAAQISNGIATGIELEKFDFPTLDDNAAPFKIHIEGTIANFLREGSGTLETPVLLQPQALFKMLSGRSKRKLPLHFAGNQILHEKLRIIPNKTQRFGAIPASVAKESHSVKYDLKIKEDGGALDIDRKLVLGAGTVPTSDFSAFLGVCREIEEADQTKIPVSDSAAKPSAAESSATESKPAGEK
jgi:tetratricopeptide (TPR) repeat protein